VKLIFGKSHSVHKAKKSAIAIKRCLKKVADVPGIQEHVKRIQLSPVKGYLIEYELE
jgi:hypothetical protein